MKLEIMQEVTLIHAFFISTYISILCWGAKLYITLFSHLDTIIVIIITLYLFPIIMIMLQLNDFNLYSIKLHQQIKYSS